MPLAILFAILAFCGGFALGVISIFLIMAKPDDD